MNGNTRIWTLGSSLLAVVILVAGWFLGISPVLGQASATADQREDAVAQNEAHAAALVSLKQRFEKIDELKLALDGQRTLIPERADIPALLGEIVRNQSATGTTLTDFSVSDAVPYIPPVSADEVPEEMQGEQASDAVEPVTVTSPRVTAENFVAVPVSLTVAGGMDQVMAFVSGLQNGSRLFLLTDVALTEDTEGGTFSGTLSGFVYVLLDGSGADPDPATPADVAAAAAG